MKQLDRGGQYKPTVLSFLVPIKYYSFHLIGLKLHSHGQHVLLHQPAREVGGLPGADRRVLLAGGGRPHDPHLIPGQ